MEYRTIQKNIGDSPRKVRLVADMVRKMTPDQAVQVLQFTQRAAAMPLKKAIQTAIANAGNKQGLSFKSIEINEGLKMKRYRVGTAGRGRGRPYKKRMSQIKVVLTDEIVDKAEKLVVQKTRIESKANRVVEKEVKKEEVKEVKVEEKKEEVKA